MRKNYLRLTVAAATLSVSSTVLADQLDLPIVPASVMRAQAPAAVQPSPSVSNAAGTETVQLTTNDGKSVEATLVRLSERPKSPNGETDSTPSDQDVQQASQPAKKRVETLKTVSREVKEDLSPVSSSRDSDDRAPEIEEQIVIEAENGVNQILNVAVGHLNRIVTPFENPRILKTSDTVTIETKGNVLYVAPSVHRQPVTMFIREKDVEDVAISLTLLPQRIPPRMYELRLKGNAVTQTRRSRPIAEQWERSNGYVSAIRALSHSIALGEIPQGYEMRGLLPSERIPLCAQKGLAFDFLNAQVLEGHHLKAIVGVVKNVSPAAIEFQESSCAAPGVRAVAAWPAPFLVPGDSSEVLIIGARATSEVPESKRPSLLRGVK